jgi:hypothetical protein
MPPRLFRGTNSMERGVVGTTSMRHVGWPTDPNAVGGRHFGSRPVAVSQYRPIQNPPSHIVVRVLRSSAVLEQLRLRSRTGRYDSDCHTRPKARRCDGRGRTRMSAPNPSSSSPLHTVAQDRDASLGTFATTTHENATEANFALALDASSLYVI